MFNAVVVMAFIASAANYWLLARKRINRPLIAFVLGCYIYTEAYVALDRPVMWLYVALSAWGLWNFWQTRD